MMRGSSYLGSTPKRAPGRPRRFVPLAALFLIFAILLSGFASVPLIERLSQSATGSGSSPALSNASALWCADPKAGELGMGMDSQKDWRSGSSWYPHSDSSGRVLTSQEAFGNGVGFVNFHGVGESPEWFFIAAPLGLKESGAADEEAGGASVVDRTGNTPSGDGADDWYSRMNSSRSPASCVFGDIGGSVANGILGLSGAITNLMSGIATFAFDPNFICEPNSGASNCIDLVGIIGGSGASSGDGIIGKLTTSVYFPLLLVAAVLVGIYIMWNGLAKRQFRETFLGVLWSLVVVILGTALLLNPLLLAKAPMVVSNALTSCVMGAFTGSSGCVDGSNGAGTPEEASAYCYASSPRNDFMDQAAITMTSMSCELWKAFVLQPYAQGSFGAPLDQLDVNRSDTVAAKILAKNQIDPQTFCLERKVQGTIDSYNNRTLSLSNGGGRTCNLAVYQAYLAVNANYSSAAGGGLQAMAAANTDGIDNRWLALAQVAASDEGMYRAWAPKDNHLAQIGFAAIGLISAALAALVVFVVAAFALAFYVTSILMIAFAPFFLLAGVHPGRGRKMMVGWIGQVLSNIMKYAASAIFLVITIALYGAVLSNVSNPGAILIFMLILTVALLMYRREIVDMVGVIDLGGQKLSNKFAQSTMDRVRNTGKTAMAVGGGVTAGILSNGVRNPFSKESWNLQNIGQDIGSVVRAGADGGRRSIKSRPGFLGETMKASDRISADNRSDMSQQSAAAAEVARKASNDKTEKKRTLDDLNGELDNSQRATAETLQGLKVEHDTAVNGRVTAQSNLDTLSAAQTTALQGVDNAAFREYQDLLNQMKDLEIKATIADESGNFEEAAAYRGSISELDTRAMELRSNLSDEDIYTGESQYSTGIANAMGREDITPENAMAQEEDIQRRYTELMGTIGRTRSQAEQVKARQAENERRLADEIIAAQGDVTQAAYLETNAQGAATKARQDLIDLKPGQVVKNSDVRKYSRNIENMQNDRSQDIDGLASGVEDKMNARSEDFISALDEREAWRGEANAQLQGANAARNELAGVEAKKSDIFAARANTVKNWAESDSSTPDGRAQRAFADRMLAASELEDARTKLDEFAAKEESDGALSELDKSNRFIAERIAKSAQERIEEDERKIAASGRDIGALEARYNRAAEAEYLRKNSADRDRIQPGGLRDFEADLASEAETVRSTIDEREAGMRAAQANATEADRRATRAERDAELLGKTASELRDRAAGDKPVGDRAAQKATTRAERRIERRGGLPVNGVTLPSDERPQVASQQPEVQAPVSEPILDSSRAEAAPERQQPAPRGIPVFDEQRPQSVQQPQAQPRQDPISPSAPGETVSSQPVAPADVPKGIPVANATEQQLQVPFEQPSQAASQRPEVLRPQTPAAQPSPVVQPVESPVVVTPQSADQPSAAPVSAPAPAVQVAPEPRVTPASQPQRAESTSAPGATQQRVETTAAPAPAQRVEAPVIQVAPEPRVAPAAPAPAAEAQRADVPVVQAPTPQRVEPVTAPAPAPAPQRADTVVPQRVDSVAAPAPQRTETPVAPTPQSTSERQPVTAPAPQPAPQRAEDPVAAPKPTEQQPAVAPTPAPQRTEQPTTPVSRSSAAQDQADRQVREAEANRARRVAQAQEDSDRTLREQADRRATEINTATEQDLREIEDRRAELSNSLDQSSTGSSRLREDYDQAGRIRKMRRSGEAQTARARAELDESARQIAEEAEQARRQELADARSRIEAQPREQKPVVDNGQQDDTARRLEAERQQLQREEADLQRQRQNSQSGAELNRMRQELEERRRSLRDAQAEEARIVQEYRARKDSIEQELSRQATSRDRSDYEEKLEELRTVESQFAEDHGVATQKIDEFGQDIQNISTQMDGPKPQGRPAGLPRPSSSTANTRSADDGNPFRGGNPFKRKK